MYKSSILAAAALWVCASTAAYGGTLSVGNTVREIANAPRASNPRGLVPAAHMSTLVIPPPHAAAITAESKVIPLDQPRAKPPAEPTASPGADGALEHRWPVEFGINWREGSNIVNPREIVSHAHNLRRTGLPIVHLWQSNKNLVALGLSPRGVPGVYFSEKLGSGAAPP
jgi:hypothetical protein